MEDTLHTSLTQRVIVVHHYIHMCHNSIPTLACGNCWTSNMLNKIPYPFSQVLTVLYLCMHTHNLMIEHFNSLPS